MVLPSKSTHRFNSISNKIPRGLFVEIDELILGLYGIAKDLEWPVLKRKNNFWELTLPDSQLLNYKATVFKTVWY